MRTRSAPIMLAAALVATLSISAAHAGMNNLNVNPGLNAPRVTPSIPNVKPRVLTIDSYMRLNCYRGRERTADGGWVSQTHCH